MLEFLSNYWYFLVAGVIFIAVVVFWIVEVCISKKKKNVSKTQEQQENKQEAEQEVEKKAEEKEEKVEEKTEKPVEKKETKKSANKKESSQKEVKKPAKKEVKEEKSKEQVKEEPAEQKVEEKPSYHVVYDPEKENWIVKKDGSERATRRCKTKQEALDVIDKLAITNELKVAINKKDGELQRQIKSKKNNG